MSSLWEIWKTKAGWFAQRWVRESPEYAGPFPTQEQAKDWATGEADAST